MLSRFVGRRRKMIAIHKLSQMPKPELERLKKRAHADIDNVKTKVEEIIAAVRSEGDDALVRFTRQWDEPAFEKSQLCVTEADIAEAYKQTPADVIASIKEQIGLSRR